MLISINILMGNDALELDQYVLENIFALEPHEYMIDLLKDNTKRELR